MQEAKIHTHYDNKKNHSNYSLPDFKSLRSAKADGERKIMNSITAKVYELKIIL
jgi:hypothetical protein